ncbi:LysR family transcriptional regulator [Psychrobacter alimentarius]|uniref:LysR family transcriptional regulator n=1 Tax=Psychrobacter alimentarius TaxID=261164 RepID=UPI003FD55456
MSNFLRRMDVNLLLTLDVLLSEQNVTRAAKRLNLSQPTVSVQLARLREIFNDPLLLPGPRGMRPTARANELRLSLNHALESLEQAVAPTHPFQPNIAQNIWRIAASDYFSATILLPLASRLRQAAPQTKIAILNMTPATIAHQAEQGLLDLAFHTCEEAPPNMRSNSIFTERYVLAGRKGHPKLHQNMTLQQFCQLEHAIVSPENGSFHGITDQILTTFEMKRQVVLSVPHFLLLESALLQSDLVALIPARLVQHNSALQVVNTPLEIPGFEILMLWSERVHRDPAHQWLRGQIVEVAEQKV